MAVAGGPNLSENGLVFYYDTDNGKSYKGEPATNSQDPDYAAFTQAGFDAWGCYDGSNSHLWDVNQSKTFLNILGPDGYPTNVMLYHNFTGGFHGPTHWSGVPAALLTAGSQITVQGWVKAADAASVGKTVTPYLYYNKVGGGSYSSGTNYALTEEWQLVSHSYTVPEGSTGTGIMYFFTQNPSEVKMYLTKTAIVGGKLHAVQWLPGATTRSATESLYDFISDNALDVSNVSFDSNADITFDGTDDRLLIADPSYPSTASDAFTLEVVFKVPTGASWNNGYYTGIIGRGGYAGSLGIIRSITDNEVVFWARVNGGTTYDPRVPNLTRDVYHHVIGTYDGAGLAKIYHNGNYVAEESGLTAGTFDAGDYLIGGGVSFSGANGGYGETDSIPVVKMYNRALTAEEVQNNFNGIRSRFGI